MPVDVSLDQAECKAITQFQDANLHLSKGMREGELTPPGNSPSCNAFGPPINMTECTLNSTPAAVIRLKSRPIGVSSRN